MLAHLAAGDHEAASGCWRGVSELTSLLFAEPSPAPVKYWLNQIGLIDSPAVRLPMLEVSSELAAHLDREIAARGPRARKSARMTDAIS